MSIFMRRLTVAVLEFETQGASLVLLLMGEVHAAR